MSWDRPFSHELRLVLVDRGTGAEVGEVPGLQRGGRVSRNLDTDAKESGSVTVVGSPDFGSRLARLYADVTFRDGGEESVCLGTFVPSWAQRRCDGSKSTVAVTLEGRLSELGGDEFDVPVSFAAGTPTVAAAASIAEGAGFDVRADESTHVLAEARTYGAADESKLAAINDLLDLAGFESASCDAYGAVVLGRYREPSERPVAKRLAEGAGSLLLRDVVDELDASEVPNVVHAVYETSESTVVGMAVDDDPASPWSVQARGYRKVKKYSYSDSSTKAAADERAAKLLDEARSVIHRVTFSHAFDPGVVLGSIVEVDYPGAGVSARLAVRTQDIDLGDGLIVKAEGREHVR